MLRENPFYYNLPTHPDDFLGRWPLVDQIAADLCRPRPDSWAVIGGRRFGKSSVLKAIESRLAARLVDCEQGDKHVLPLIVDLKGCRTESERSIYACILHELRQALDRNRELALNLSQSLLHTITDNHTESLSFYQFKRALNGLAACAKEQRGPLRLVLLLDEVEATTRHPWSENLFNNLRSLIYGGSLADVVRLVLTGSVQVIRVRHAGSPLLNAVKIDHLESFSEDDMQALIARGGEVPGDVSFAVQAQSGGHPFIAQYLLHHLWDNGLAGATPARVEQVARQMRQQRTADLQGWWEAVGDSGQRAYAFLTDRQDWVDERTLLSEIHDTVQPLDQGLAALCYHGLAVRDDSWQRYRSVGQLFSNWFVQSVPPRGERATAATIGAPQEPPLSEIDLPSHIQLAEWEISLLQHVHRGVERVYVEREFSGGYSGTRVLLTLPVAADDRSAARRVTKLGSVRELRTERDNYERYVKSYLPFYTAPVEGFYEQGDRAGLSYLFLGEGELGPVVDLEEYYRNRSAEQIIELFKGLLEGTLGRRWYRETNRLRCRFAAEYGRHLVEHLRLKLRAESSDTFWLNGQPSPTATGYAQIEAATILGKHREIEPNTLCSVEGLIVKKIRSGVVKLWDPKGRGIVVRVACARQGDVPQWLKPGIAVGVRGEVVYNRHGRMVEVLRAAFPDLPSGTDSETIELPSYEETVLNPLHVYSAALDDMLEGKQSYVHGDLHLRNVLVDESGKGWLIDFARVEERHNLFDFVKLETYVRLMALARDDLDFSLGEYVQFEKALAAATLNKGGEVCPANADLQRAYQVIGAVREIAQKYMRPPADLRNEYFRALFLYCLAVTKYYDERKPQPTRLAFATAGVLARYISEGKSVDLSRPTVFPSTSKGRPLAPQPKLGTSQRWAVLVGVNKYPDSVISDLQVCADDVTAIHRALTPSYQVAKLLTDATPKHLPTRANILGELSTIAQTAGEDDLLLFYFSGHGKAEGGESYLLARDTRLSALEHTAVSMRNVREMMNKSPARAKVIVLDACHSGASIGKAEPTMTAEFIRRVFEEAEGIAVLASCKQGQQSWEWIEKQRSAFTYHLLLALDGQADRDDKGFVTISDVHRYVTNGVKEWAAQRGFPQTPTLQYTAAGDIPLLYYTQGAKIDGPRATPTLADPAQDVERTLGWDRDLSSDLRTGSYIEPDSRVSLTDNKSGISPILHKQLRTVLVNCGPFDNYKELGAVFVDERISPWKGSIPKTDNPISQVDAVISYLVDQYTVNQKNALVLLLRVLSERLDPGNVCHRNLAKVADRLEQELLNSSTAQIHL